MRVKSFNGYLSRHIYDNLVPQNDFFRKLNEILDWRNLVFDLQLLAKNDHGGRPRHSPVTLFKMLFLSFLYNASDRQTEELCQNNIRCKYFVELEITELSPDFSTLCLFRNEIIEKMGINWLNDSFAEIVSEAVRLGVSFDPICALDSTHTLANVDTIKDKKRESPLDEDAKWGAKGTETKLTPDNKKVKAVKFFFGYKSHILAEAENGLITKISASPGNTADIDAGEDMLINQLSEREKKRVKTVTADKAYGCGVLIGILEKDHQIQTAFKLNKQFLKGEHRDRWLAYLDDPIKNEARGKRYVVERVNADLKNNHGLAKARYIGLAKYQLQATMAAMAYNLKRMVNILTGVRFRPA